MSTFSKILYEEAKKPGIEIVRYRLRRGEDIIVEEDIFLIRRIYRYFLRAERFYDIPKI